MDSTPVQTPPTSEAPQLTFDQTYKLLCKTPVKDKNTALYVLYCFLKRGALTNMLSSDEIEKLNLCIEKFPGLEKVSS
jgi:hypothetical protein